MKHMPTQRFTCDWIDLNLDILKWKYLLCLIFAHTAFLLCAAEVQSPGTYFIYHTHGVWDINVARCHKNLFIIIIIPLFVTIDLCLICHAMSE